MRRTALLLLAAASTLTLAACGASKPMPADTAAEAPSQAYAPGARGPSGAYAPPSAAMGADEAEAPPAAAPRPAESVPRPVAVAAAAPPPPGVAGAAGGVSPGAKVAETEVRRPPAVAASGVRAGEWDDNANYRDFLGYIGKVKGIEQLDVSSRRFVVVQDKDGNGVPSCKVTLTDSGTQKTATLTTAASGRALFFPGAYGMSGKGTASATCNAQKAVTAAYDSSDNDGTIQIKLPVARPNVSQPALDVVFVLDTTGSMSEEIESVKATLKTVLSRLDAGVKIRVGLVEYKDRTDGFVTKKYALTSDIKALSTSIEAIHASGGGDRPEDVNAGLAAAIDEMKWNDKAAARLAFLIADAPPHLDYANSTPYTTSAKRAAEKGIKVFTVAASGMDALGQAVFRQIAQVTGGTNMFVLRGGAGPQSTGGGDPKSSCGATHQNYSSGNLDQLIAAKLALEITSLKADPLRIPGLAKDENAKACADRVLIVAR